MLAPVLDLDEGPRAPRARELSGATGTPRDVRDVAPRGSPGRLVRLSRSPSRSAQPVLLLVADDQVHAGNPRHRLGVGLRVAARDHQERVGIVARRCRRIAWRSEKSARPVTVHVLTTCTCGRSSAGGGAGSRGPRTAPRISCDSTWLSRHPSVETAMVPGSVTRARPPGSWPQAAPMSSPLLHLTVAMMPVLEEMALEREDARQRRPRKPRALPVVERDEVHLAPGCPFRSRDEPALRPPARR